MSGVWLVFVAEFRRRWRSWLILAALIALVGGLVIAAADAGRRTATAFPRFVSAYGYDVAAFNPQSGPALLRFPEIALATHFDSPLTGQPTCTCGRRIPAQDFGVVEMSSAAMHQTSKLESGRWPDQSKPDEVLASFPLAQNLGVRVGTVIGVPFYAASQAGAVDAGGALPVPTRALAAQLLSATSANSIYLVRLHHGAADLPRFNSEVQPLVAGTSNLDAVAENVQASIHPQAVGWWVLAALMALAGIAVVGQAIGRQSLVESGDYGTLRAIGLSPRQLIAVMTVRNLAVALVGVMGAIALAVALSPLTPLGEARVVEPSTGFAFDPVALPLGALSLVLVVLLLGVWPAVRVSRRRFAEDRNTFARPFPIVSRLSAMGAPPSAVVGVRRAFERGRGLSAVPVVSAFLGTTLAVLALSATAVFGASLGHLLSTPDLYGDAFQVMFSPNSAQPLPSHLVSDLQADPAISGITEGVGTEVTINGIGLAAIALNSIRGPLLLSTVNRIRSYQDWRDGSRGFDHASSRCPCGISHPSDCPSANGWDAYHSLSGGLASVIPRRLRERRTGDRGGVQHRWVPRCRVSAWPCTGDLPSRCATEPAPHRPSSGRFRSRRTSSYRPIWPRPQFGGPVPYRPDLARQLRSGGELPPHFGLGSGGLRGRHTRACARGQRGPPTA